MGAGALGAADHADTLARFLHGTPFVFFGDQERQVGAFLIVAESDFAPIVGQQVTLTATNSALTGERIDLLLERARTDFTPKVLGGNTKAAEVIAKLNIANRARGFLGQETSPGVFEFLADDGTPPISDAALRAFANLVGQEITYTAVPPGSGTRMGIDRDEDGALDAAEVLIGIDPANRDSDGDGYGDAQSCRRASTRGP